MNQPAPERLRAVAAICHPDEPGQERERLTAVTLMVATVGTAEQAGDSIGRLLREVALQGFDVRWLTMTEATPLAVITEEHTTHVC